MSLRQTDLQTALLETTWGRISIDAGARGIIACHVPEAPARPVLFRIQRERIPLHAHPVLRKAVAFARAMLEGINPGRCPAVNPSYNRDATDFRRAIWTALRRIPRGQTVTYAELARSAGIPRAARAAGGACGANPLPLFIPCHRVVAAGGGIGGYSAGIAWKLLLLQGEDGGR